MSKSQVDGLNNANKAFPGFCVDCGPDKKEAGFSLMTNPPTIFPWRKQRLSDPLNVIQRTIKSNRTNKTQTYDDGL